MPFHEARFLLCFNESLINLNQRCRSFPAFLFSVYIISVYNLFSINIFVSCKFDHH